MTRMLLVVLVAGCGEYQAVDAAGFGGCALATDGALDCWDDAIPFTVVDTPDGVFTAVDVAGSVAWPSACALRDDGTPVCWNDDHDWDVEVPEGPFQAVQAGWNRDAGLRDDGSVEYWNLREVSGSFDTPTPQAPEGVAFTQISVGVADCGVTVDGEVLCWGDMGLEVPALDLPVVQVEVGLYACALTEDGEATCWGSGVEPDPLRPPAGPFTAITVADDAVPVACGLRTDGTVDCWGDDRYSGLFGSGEWGMTDQPDAGFTDIAAADHSVCGLLDNGHVRCWGAGKSRPL